MHEYSCLWAGTSPQAIRNRLTVAAGLDINITLFSRVTLISKVQSTSDLDYFHARDLHCSTVEEIAQFCIAIYIYIDFVVLCNCQCHFQQNFCSISTTTTTVCSKKSDAKIEITITATNLIRIKYPLSIFNYHLSGANVENFNKIHCTVFEQQLFKKWNSKTEVSNREKSP